MNLIKLAYRNIWRNKRRTLITAASIFSGIFFALLMRSIQLGTYDVMIEDTIGKVSGYLQVQNIDYFDEPNLDNSMPYSDTLIQKIRKIKGVKAATARIEAGALASSGNKSKSVFITGINPKEEKDMSNPKHLIVHYKLTEAAIEQLKKEIPFDKKQLETLEQLKGSVYNRLSYIKVDLLFDDVTFEKYRPVFQKYCYQKGQYLEQNDQGILVAHLLAKALDVNVGDTLILISQGYHGASAAGLFPVRALVKSPSPRLNNKLIYMSNNRAQKFFNMKGRINYIAINIDEQGQMLEVENAIAEQIDDANYSVKNWQALFPETHKMIEGDNQGGQVFILILYFVIFFGILGTVMMMINERKREFAVLNALGMKKQKLRNIILYEMMITTLLGVVIGLLVSLPIISYLANNPIHFTGVSAKSFEEMGYSPIMKAQSFGSYFYKQIAAVFIMVAIACFIPLRKIRKFKTANALKE